MSIALLFFYGTIITSIMTFGIYAYAKAAYRESKQLQVNYSNFGSD